MNARSRLTSAVAVMFIAAAIVTGQAPAPSLTVLSKEGRRSLAIVPANDQELVALDDLAAMFQLNVREETGAITVSYKGKTIVLTPDQALASVSGRLVSLPAAPVRSGRRWLVPVEFLNRALALVYESKLDLRKPSHLLVVGDLRVPRVVVRYDPGAGTAPRLTLDATPRAPSTVSQENDHLSIKFEADLVDLAAPPIQPQGTVQAIRLADPTTVDVALGPQFAGFRATTTPSDASTRLTIDFLVSQSSAAASPAPAAAAPPPPLPPPDLGAPGGPSIRTIVIDPGHGGPDEGVHGAAGVREKDLTLLIARRLRSTFEGRLGIRTLLTRDDDRNPTPDERAALANNNKADVFVSLHANASFRKAMSGAAIYCASFDGQPQAAADTQKPERLPVFGGGIRDIELVPWDRAQSRHVDRSAQLAETVAAQFHDRVPLAARPVVRAPLRVLESVNMPAVLIEMGFLTNPDQEKQLGEPEFQNGLVQAVYDAVMKFREGAAR